MLLLQKIEELTLHLIDQQKQIYKQYEMNETLFNILKKQEEELNKLKNK